MTSCEKLWELGERSRTGNGASTNWIRDDMCHKYSSFISQEALSFYFWLPCCPLLCESLITQDLACELKESTPPLKSVKRDAEDFFLIHIWYGS